MQYKERKRKSRITPTTDSAWGESLRNKYMRHWAAAYICNRSRDCTCVQLHVFATWVMKGQLRDFATGNRNTNKSLIRTRGFVWTNTAFIPSISDAISVLVRSSPVSLLTVESCTIGACSHQILMQYSLNLVPSFIWVSSYRKYIFCYIQVTDRAVMCAILVNSWFQIFLMDLNEFSFVHYSTCSTSEGLLCRIQWLYKMIFHCGHLLHHCRIVCDMSPLLLLR